MPNGTRTRGGRTQRTNLSVVRGARLTRAYLRVMCEVPLLAEMTPTAAMAMAMIAERQALSPKPPIPPAPLKSWAKALLADSHFQGTELEDRGIEQLTEDLKLLNELGYIDEMGRVVMNHDED